VSPAQTRLAVAALTVIGFALRLEGLDQSLYGDEGYTLGIVDGQGFGDVISAVHDTSITPPLHYALAWLAVQAGDASVTVRLPSLILGTATIPLVYLLGRQVAGAGAGLVAAAIVALSPFALFYSVEARAYATMMFLVTASTLALLRALDGGRRAWWIVYGVSACLALYCHYSAVFVIAVQAIWALAAHRDRWRAVVAVHLAVAIGYAPWLPSWLHQRDNDFADAVDLLYPLSVDSAFDYPARLLPGHPFVGIDALPGRIPAILLALTVLAAIAALGVRAARARARPFAESAGTTLIALLALATPVGILAWSLAGTSLYAPRNLSASLPALAVLLAAVVTAAGPRLARPLTAITLALFAVAAVRSLDDANQRPPYKQVAQYIDRTARPGEPVVAGEQELLATLFEKDHPLLTAGFDDGPAYARAASGARPVFIVRDSELQPGLPRLTGPNGLLVLREGRQFDGFVRLSVGRYAGEAEGRIAGEGGRAAIRFSTGERIPVAPGAAIGFVDGAAIADGVLTAGGWATSPSGDRPAERVLAFSGSRLLAVGKLRLRPDLAERFGKGALTSGFEVSARIAAKDIARVRLFAVVDGRASRLRVTGTARRIGRDLR
jgi:hypothetical protein